VCVEPRNPSCCTYKHIHGGRVSITVLWPRYRGGHTLSDCFGQIIVPGTNLLRRSVSLRGTPDAAHGTTPARQLLATAGPSAAQIGTRHAAKGADMPCSAARQGKQQQARSTIARRSMRAWGRRSNKKSHGNLIQVPGCPSTTPASEPEMSNGPGPAGRRARATSRPDTPIGAARPPAACAGTRAAGPQGAAEGRRYAAAASRALPPHDRTGRAQPPADGPGARPAVCGNSHPCKRPLLRRRAAADMRVPRRRRAAEGGAARRPHPSANTARMQAADPQPPRPRLCAAASASHVARPAIPL
jgi:hypothetical protein